ncbi:hypothetical protein HG537_0F03070 [Torulaspora globosa]|uniref:MADS-box domain-containing protein n=1 Tax=Torulaspora globosa TaxID=48254 RepID=A0A7H9HY88_9SACH|nr:hypothetical protein HG537_0F03070 [Torulaspora sp. CBS 2947]
MGRRKIEIQPIQEERNRTVTFIKRKSGLFKKAHELAVLCQVDVAVLILGSNNTFYEFSSVDMQNMIEYYQRDDLAHDVKGPSDFGAYRRKSHITLNEHVGRRARRGREEEEDTSVPVSGRVTRSALKREQQEEEEHEEVKKHKSDRLPKFNPLQQMVQRQFQNLYRAASNPPQAPVESNYSSGPLAGAAPPLKVESKRRPVLRVQIPSSNKSYNSGSPTNASSGVAGLVSRNASAVRYDLPVNQRTPKRPTPTAVQGAEMGSKYLMPDKNDPNRLSAKPPSGNSLGLPPMFSASPAFPPYLATPLQASGVGTANIHGPPYPMLKQLQMSQQHLQQQQHSGQPNLPAQTPRNPVRASTPPLGEHSAGPLTGSLPSKFAHDLMVPSPNTTMSMFQDWTIAPGTAKATSTMPSNPVPGTEIPASTYNNGSTGLTPYMMVNQTPLANRYFNFSSEATDDKNHGNNDVLSNTKGP